MRRVGLVVVSMTLTVLLVVPAEARPRSDRHHRPHRRNPGVTLNVAPAVVDHGNSVTASGTIDPPAAGEQVVIKNAQGDTMGTTNTDAGGSFQVAFAPDRNMTVHAEWGAESSPGVDIGVRAVVDVNLQDVRLFGEALVTGTVTPAGPGSVDIKLMQGTHKVATDTASLTPAGAFRTKLPIEEPGAYTVVASYEDATHLQGTDTSAKRTTPLPRLHAGSDGISVLLLERRLVDLDYHLTGVDKHFDERTADAVLAFRKVHNMVRTSVVDGNVWRALAQPREPQIASNMTRFHFEVDLSKQIMIMAKGGEIVDIMHVSTGKPSTPTPPGKYRIMFKRPGMNSSGMYYSAYFLQHFAIHGYASVPSYNASHGCVRVPFWTAKWVYGLAKVGTPIWIYP